MIGTGRALLSKLGSDRLAWLVLVMLLGATLAATLMSMQWVSAAEAIASAEERDRVFTDAAANLPKLIAGVGVVIDFVVFSVLIALQGQHEGTKRRMEMKMADLQQAIELSQEEVATERLWREIAQATNARLLATNNRLVGRAMTTSEELKTQLARTAAFHGLLHGKYGVNLEAEAVEVLVRVRHGMTGMLCTLEAMDACFEPEQSGDALQAKWRDDANHEWGDAKDDDVVEAGVLTSRAEWTQTLSQSRSIQPGPPRLQRHRR